MKKRCSFQSGGESHIMRVGELVSSGSSCITYRILVRYIVLVSSRIDKTGSYRNFDGTSAVVYPDIIGMNRPYTRYMNELTPWDHNVLPSRDLHVRAFPTAIL